MTKTWLEAAINGPWGRERQPGSPTTVEACIEDGVACADAGAAIIHVHAFDSEADEQDDDPDVYAKIIEGIKDQVDAVVYPTIPPATFEGEEMSGRERFAHLEDLGERGLLEWVQNDPGSINVNQFEMIEQDEAGHVYENSEEMIRTGLDIAARFGGSPAYAIFDPSFLRMGAALVERYPETAPPIYRFMFSESFTFGYPPEPYALKSYLTLLESEVSDGFWMLSGLDVDITPLIPEAVDRGGHVRVGLEDAPLGTERSNVEWVERAKHKIEESGGKLASPEEVRTEIEERDTV